MNGTQFSGPDAARSRLRATVATVDHEIRRELSRLPTQVTDDESKKPTNGLAAAWADLIGQLALGPEPEVRECPVCKHIGMRTATLCGHCWTKLTPLTELDGVVG